MTILAEILDRVKKSDESIFQAKIEAQEAEAKKHINLQGFDTISDMLERKLQSEQMTFKLDEGPAGGQTSVPHQTTPAVAEGASVTSTPDSDIYKKFLDQVK